MVRNSSIQSILVRGNSGRLIEIECSITNGLPSMTIIGLGNKTISEAKERIRNAFSVAKLPFPKKRITINLAPADIPKDSTGFDMAMAVAILIASKSLPYIPKASEAFIGEVSLDGKIRAIRGIIGQIVTGKQLGITEFFVPRPNIEQALLIPDIQVIPVDNLTELYNYLCNPSESTRENSRNSIYIKDESANPFVDIVGQDAAKRALIIAAAGGHNIFLSGPPGTGKSMLAKALPHLLPPLQINEILEVTHLHSLANNDYEKLITVRPFRSPHHGASQTAIIGGGSPPKPGEISLSHKGVLFLDEIPEFSRSTLEALRQPLEDKIITVARVLETVEFPADFILVATANPCPCGYYGSEYCSCSASSVNRYQNKLSGPIMDRIDMHITVSQVDHQMLLSNPIEAAQKPHKQIVAARNTQYRRQGPSTLNNILTNQELKAYAQLNDAAKQLLNTAATRLKLSARSYVRIVKVARTIADLDDSLSIESHHIAEALQYRIAKLGSQE